MRKGAQTLADVRAWQWLPATVGPLNATTLIVAMPIALLTTMMLLLVIIMKMVILLLTITMQIICC